MAWNPSPEVAALRAFGKKFDRPIVITLSLRRDGQAFHLTTYGENVKLCKFAGTFGDEILKAISDGRIDAPDEKGGSEK